MWYIKHIKFSVVFLIYEGWKLSSHNACCGMFGNYISWNWSNMNYHTHNLNHGKLIKIKYKHTHTHTKKPTLKISPFFVQINPTFEKGKLQTSSPFSTRFLALWATCMGPSPVPLRIIHQPERRAECKLSSHNQPLQIQITSNVTTIYWRSIALRKWL